MWHHSHGWGLANLGAGAIMSVVALWMNDHPGLQVAIFYGGIAIFVIGILILGTPAAKKTVGWIKRRVTLFLFNAVGNGVVDEWLPLKDAARHVYDEIQGLAISELIMGETQTANQKLNACANFILSYGRVHAQKPPSERYELISKDDVGNVYVKDDCDTIGTLLSNEPMFVGAKVRQSDLCTFIAWAKANNRDFRGP